jgi:hypothetical protein
MTQQLSLAAQAVALSCRSMQVLGSRGLSQALSSKRFAAALRAAAKHCVPDDSEGHWVYIPHVLAIADELEAQ